MYNDSFIEGNLREKPSVKYGTIRMHFHITDSLNRICSAANVPIVSMADAVPAIAVHTTILHTGIYMSPKDAVKIYNAQYQNKKIK